MSFRVGVDVGGTFTDIYAYDSVRRRSWVAKTPTTPHDQSLGVIEGIKLACEGASAAMSAIDEVLHGTTVATNALLERTGGTVALVTSQGYGSMLDLADSWTPGPLFGFFSYMPTSPIVARDLVVEASERIDESGTDVIQFEIDSTVTAVRTLVERGVSAVAVCLIHAYRFPEHEHAIKRRLRDEFPSIPVSLSSEVSREFREYQRANTTVLNAYLSPVLDSYLDNVESGLKRAGVDSDLRIVRSDGGLMSVREARQRPVSTALSGPSGGTAGAALVASLRKTRDIITFDMGGTSTDVAVCTGGRAALTRETKIAGLPVTVPSVAVETIGAGGGSIADVSEITGGLRVGPNSSGAQPGPACYGRGGTKPTVTDANLVLGNLPPALLGGAMELDRSAAYRAVSPIGEALGITTERAAQAIIDIVNGNMLGALRVATVEKGLEARQFSLVAFGGAGGLHANALASELGISEVIIPPNAGVLSAMGFVGSDVENEFMLPFQTVVGELSEEELKATLQRLHDLGESWLAEEDIAPADRATEYLFDLRYRRQGYELTVPIRTGEVEARGREALLTAFRAAHEKAFGFTLPTSVELVAVRARVRGRTEALRLDSQEPTEVDASVACIGTQPSWTSDGWSDVDIYDRRLLEPGMMVKGKAIISQYESTTLIQEQYHAYVDSYYNLVISGGERDD